MLRISVAIVLGAGLAMVLIMVVEFLGHAIYPPPPDLDFNDMQAVRAYVQTVPAGALLLVLVAWLAGTFGGGLLTSLIAKNRPVLYAGIIGGLVLLGTIFNFSVIPHPTWFVVLSVVAILLTTWVTGRISAKFFTRTRDT